VLLDYFRLADDRALSHVGTNPNVTTAYGI
jgi:hypothetical protein